MKVVIQLSKKILHPHNEMSVNTETHRLNILWRVSLWKHITNIKITEENWISYPYMWFLIQACSISRAVISSKWNEENQQSYCDLMWIWDQKWVQTELNWLLDDRNCILWSKKSTDRIELLHDMLKYEDFISVPVLMSICIS